jgi:hypothetical protein
MRKINRIIVHHSLTSDGRVVDFRSILNYHTKVLGWEDIGYHRIVEKIGDGFFVLCGRDEEKIGAHCKDHNLDSLGICFVGNYDLEEPNEEMLREGVRRAIIWWMYRYGINLNQIYFHRDFCDYKTCPGLKFDKNRFLDLVKEEFQNEFKQLPDY